MIHLQPAQPRDRWDWNHHRSMWRMSRSERSYLTATPEVLRISRILRGSRIIPKTGMLTCGKLQKVEKSTESGSELLIGTSHLQELTQTSPKKWTKLPSNPLESQPHAIPFHFNIQLLDLLQGSPTGGDVTGASGTCAERNPFHGLMGEWNLISLVVFFCGEELLNQNVPFS